ncbi:hypothetical protein [Vitreimonas sp.]|uniref:hypothetical protein n=1 Tax=Vitreimonas sp. TaxID=3069702 RepID=UPI002ED9E246
MIRNLPPQARRGDLRYSFAALAVIAAYLDIELIPGKADPFFKFELNAEGGIPGPALSRLRAIAVALFTLRNLRCFEDFHRRLTTREMSGVFWECFWAHALSQDGFKIIAVRETNVRGADFDFTAIKNGRRICVEVTALTAPTFNETTIFNALQTKRAQLPADKPGVVICVLPEGWFAEDNVHEVLHRCVRRLFGASARVNAVVFTTEHCVPVEGQAGVWLNRYPLIRHFHENPRHALDLKDSFLRPDKTETEYRRSVTVDEGRRTSENMSSRPYYRWVDSLLDGEAA